MASIEPPIPAIAAHNFAPITPTRPSSAQSVKELNAGLGRWRRPVGLATLALVIFLWTATSFLASAILADHSFSHPFFVIYVNTIFFVLPLPPALLHKAYRHPEEFREWIGECKTALRTFYARFVFGGNDSKRRSRRDSNEGSREALLRHPRLPTPSPAPPAYQSAPIPTQQLSISETFKLSLQFCFLWFLGSYFLAVCLEHTSVASSTILTSTSSGFTLVFGAMFGVEKFTLRKFLGVALSLTGVVLVSSVDLSGQSSDDKHRGDFPQKSMHELALGNTLALLSAVIYAMYMVRMKKRIPDETAVSMPLFFGFVGLSNVVLLWPLFFILHWTGFERFEMPATGRVIWILLLNGAGSMISDVAWAYSVVLTSPILVTVGLSMTIPLTLVGQMVLNGQTSTVTYWIGAVIVVLSFIIVSHEEKKEEIVGQPDEWDIER